jgi:hypothetical protein
MCRERQPKGHMVWSHAWLSNRTFLSCRKDSDHERVDGCMPA